MYQTKPYHTVSNHSIPYLTIPYRIKPGYYHTITTITEASRVNGKPSSYHTIPYHYIPYHTIPHHSIPNYTKLYHTTQYPTIPYPTTTPYHTLQRVLGMASLQFPVSPRDGGGPLPATDTQLFNHLIFRLVCLGFPNKLKYIQREFS